MGEKEKQVLHPVQVYNVIDPVDIRSVSAEEKQTTLVRILFFPLLSLPTHTANFINIQ